MSENRGFSQQDGISLREHLEKEIIHLREWFLLARESDQTAQSLYAREVERRLLSLNNEADRIAKILEKTIPREVHEGDVKRIDIRLVEMSLDLKGFVTKDDLSNILKEPAGDIKTLNTYRDISTGRASQSSLLVTQLFLVVTAILALAGLIVNILQR